MAFGTEGYSTASFLSCWAVNANTLFGGG
jgi:hypothetical protein